MIADSVPWKRDLRRDSVTLNRRLARFRESRNDWPTPELTYQIERYCMLTAFAVRRLLESEKLSTEFEKASYSTWVYARRTEGYVPFDHLTVGDLDKRFVLDDSSSRQIQPSPLVNLIIHSADFAIGMDEERNVIYFLTSAHHSRSLWQIALSEIDRLAQGAAHDRIVSARYERDPKTGAMLVMRRSRHAAESNSNLDGK